MSDLISRQAAIDAFTGKIEITERANAVVVYNYIELVQDRIKRLPAADVVEVPPELKQVVADLIQEYKDYDMLTPDAALGKALNAVKVNYNLGKYYILDNQS